MSHQERKEAYERVLGTVEMNTRNQHQGVWIRGVNVKTILCANGTMDGDAVEKALRAAVENDDLVRDGDRYRLPE